jgi:hypothetical protein
MAFLFAIGTPVLKVRATVSEMPKGATVVTGSIWILPL